MGLRFTLLPLFICIGLIIAQGVFAQIPERYSSGEVYASIQRLRVLGTVLYVAAHPDDENTRLISYLANDLNAHTTYLSVTRGDGGQNLIGPEISELLGVIRTQELLQARRIDHGEQRFTRANDFGYSKTPEETLAFWNEEDILSDVVWAIRTIQPDVIINRFSAQPQPGNHGHHVASAILSSKAFDISADPSVFPEQLKYVQTWKPSRLFHNTTWWFYGSREKFDEVDKSNMVLVDVGIYDPVNGWSNSEIAAMSRSMHKSQGFGATPTRGSEKEYLEIIKGDMPTDKSNLFAGINTTWSRVQGGAHIDEKLEAILSEFDFTKPSSSVVPLLGVRQSILDLSPSIWRSRKLAEIDKVIAKAAGLFLEADAAIYHVAAGDSVAINLEAINRSEIPMQLLSTEFLPAKDDLTWTGAMPFNQRLTALRKVRIPSTQPHSTPYWLEQTGTMGRYSVEDQLLRGLPEAPRTIAMRYTLKIMDDTIAFDIPVIYKETDPVQGEIYRPFEIVPPVFVNIGAPAYIYNSSEEKEVHVTIKAAKANVTGNLRLKTPAGWNANPAQIDITLDKIGEEKRYVFLVSPTPQAEDGLLKAEVETEGRLCNQMLTEIAYNHIPAQTVLRESIARVVHVDLKCVGQRIAYIHGAGDDIPTSLSQVGYTIDLLSLDDISGEQSLQRYDAVILGIRAYNTLDRIKFVQQHLFDYVEDGGTLITQYNTSTGNAEQVAPYPLTISRKRVTDEQAEVTFINPTHPALNIPNKLTPGDFEGWVQERGLYFPDTWDPAFEPLLSMADPGEEPLIGGLLVAKHGKGYFVYTGLSFFRQLPDGVPGAYRLFANLIALGQNGKS